MLRLATLRIFPELSSPSYSTEAQFGHLPDSVQFLSEPQDTSLWPFPAHLHFPRPLGLSCNLHNPFGDHFSSCYKNCRLDSVCRFLGKYGSGWQNFSCGYSLLTFIFFSPPASSFGPLSSSQRWDWRLLSCSNMGCARQGEGRWVRATEGGILLMQRDCVTDSLLLASRYFMWPLPASWNVWTLSPGPRSTLTSVRLCQVCLSSVPLSTRSGFWNTTRWGLTPTRNVSSPGLSPTGEAAYLPGIYPNMCFGVPHVWHELWEGRCSQWCEFHCGQTCPSRK